MYRRAIALIIRVYFLHLYGVQSFFAVNHFKLDPVFFANGNTIQAGDVDENVPVGIVFNNESVPFTFVKEFYYTCLHRT